MQTLKKKEAYARALKVFGPWNTWRREHHLAYGLIRGVPYPSMERCCNDNPHAIMVEYALWELGAWPDQPKPSDGKFHCIPSGLRQEVCRLIEWIHKPVRGPRIRPSNRQEAQQDLSQ